MKKMFALLVLLIFSVGVFAHGHEEELAKGKSLVESKASCSDLSDDQLEAIGEYIMETMHPGEAHEQMHEMMGLEEDTPEHEQFHVHIAQMMYCNKGMAGGMMPGMMGPGMMGGYGGMHQGMMYGQRAGMMGTAWTVGSVLWLVVLVGLALLVWLWVIKILREVFGGRR